VVTTSPPSTTSLSVAVDPEVVSKKDYENICGIGFETYSLQERLEKANYLYPKHVEVIKDFDHIVSQMVDEVVSLKCALTPFFET